MVRSKITMQTRRLPVSKTMALAKSGSITA